MINEIAKGKCDFCGKDSDYLFFDKMHGVDCMDQEGYFCFKCRKDTGLINEDEMDYYGGKE